MKSSSSVTIAELSLPGAQNRDELLRVIDDLQSAAGELASQIFPRVLKRFALPQFPESTITRARKGSSCNPAFRVSLCLLALRKAGAPREHAQRLLDFQSELVRRWWDTDASRDSAVLDRAAQIDAHEDLAEREYLQKRPGGRDLFLALQRDLYAVLPSVISYLEAEAAIAEVTS